jgi:hypothetical protein
VVRFVLPQGVPAGGLVLHSPFGTADIWQDGAWKPVTCNDASCAGPSVGGPATSCCGSGPVPPCPPNVPCAPPSPVIVSRPGGPGVALAVPDGAVTDGVVYARFVGPVSPLEGTMVTLGRAS